MTPPETDLRDAVACVLDPHAFTYGDRNYYGPDLDKAADSARLRVALKAANTLITGPFASHFATLRAEVGRLKAERDEADRRAGAAERQHASGFDARVKADHWKRQRKAERGYHDNVSFDRVWAETCALADRALAAEAEATRLRALLDGAVEGLRWIADSIPATCDMTLAHDMAWRARATLASLTPKDPA